MKVKKQFANLNSRRRGWAGNFLPASVIVMMAGLVALAAPAAQAQTFQVLHAFSGGSDGAEPWAGVILDPAGNLYGTTFYGGSTSAGCVAFGYGCGVVFKLDPAGNETVLYTFKGLASGINPRAGLLRDKAGNLYGTTFEGGDLNCGRVGCGTIFKIDATGHVSLLYSFTGKGDDEHPQSPLIADAAGNLYGTTVGQTAFTSGTVFKLDSAGNETVLHVFTGPPDGGMPVGSLVRDAHGNLAGATSYGGNGTGCVSLGCGLVFKISPTGQESVLYNFTGGTDGAYPIVNPVLDAAGNLYGTTGDGGDLNCGPNIAQPYGCGVIFKVNSSGVETVLYAFTGETTTGYNPYAGVIRDAVGNLYGTTYRGGTYASGTVYKVDPSGHETVLYSFTGGADGAYPAADLAMDAEGNLYGTNVSGGNLSGCGGGGCGVVFKIVP
ncbi:MAG TPA: choice-of-anchor tandem repeat GloVer-containing protein [Candidatus Sulfotelmatobacter sp.]